MSVAVFKNYTLAGQLDVLANAMYVHLPPHTSKYPSKVAKTKTVQEDNETIINFDYDEGGKIVGIEFINARKLLGIDI